MKGDGSIYQRHAASCSNKGRARADRTSCACPYWLKYYFRGEMVREPASDGPDAPPVRTEREARRKLRARINAIRGDRFVGPDEQKLTIGELLDALERHLTLKGRSVRSFASHIKAMRKHFGLMRAVDLTAAGIERYQAAECAAAKPRAMATLNREVEVLRMAFRLAHRQDRLSRLPHFPMLPEENVRQGFVELATFDKVATALPCDLADAARFAYLTGWRRGQVGKLGWQHVDQTNRLLAVPGSLTKNGAPQTIPLAGELWEIIERRRARREIARKDGSTFLSPHLFHRGDGLQLGDFRKAWANACSAAGVPGLLFHDLRRSAARNLVRAGVDRDVARKITGHKTESMFARYNVTDTRDQVEAFKRVGQYVEEQSRQAKVATIGERP